MKSIEHLTEGLFLLFPICYRLYFRQDLPQQFSSNKSKLYAELSRNICFCSFFCVYFYNLR